MKVLQYSLFVFLLFSFPTYAQFEKGEKLFTIGAGLNSNYTGGIPLAASFDSGITDKFYAGVMVGYLRYQYPVFVGLKNQFNGLLIAARGSYHIKQLTKSSRWDIYGSVMPGYLSFFWDFTNIDHPYNDHFFIGGLIGAKYYFSPKVAFSLELGELGLTNVLAGITFKAD